MAKELGTILAAGNGIKLEDDNTNITIASGPIAVNAQTGTSYTPVLADAGKLITLSNGSAIAVTVPTNAAVAYPIGTVIALAQLGAGLVTVVGATGVTINGTTPGNAAMNGQWSSAALTKLATDTWHMSGAAE